MRIHESGSQTPCRAWQSMNLILDFGKSRNPDPRIHQMHENHWLWIPESKGICNEDPIICEFDANNWIWISQHIKLHESGSHDPWNPCNSMNLDPRMHANPWIFPSPTSATRMPSKMSCRCLPYSFRMHASRCQILAVINKIMANHGANSFAINYDLALRGGGGLGANVCKVHPAYTDRGWGQAASKRNLTQML